MAILALYMCHHTCLQVATVPLISSDFSATMTLSFVPGMNLNEEKPRYWFHF